MSGDGIDVVGSGVSTGLIVGIVVGILVIAALLFAGYRVHSNGSIIDLLLLKNYKYTLNLNFLTFSGLLFKLIKSRKNIFYIYNNLKN